MAYRVAMPGLVLARVLGCAWEPVGGAPCPDDRRHDKPVADDHEGVQGWTPSSLADAVSGTYSPTESFDLVQNGEDALDATVTIGRADGEVKEVEVFDELLFDEGMCVETRLLVVPVAGQVSIGIGGMPVQVDVAGVARATEGVDGSHRFTVDGTAPLGSTDGAYPDDAELFVEVQGDDTYGTLFAEATWTCCPDECWSATFCLLPDECEEVVDCERDDCGTQLYWGTYEVP